MTSDQRDLLQALTYLYLRHGQNRRALTLVLLAARDAPDNIAIMRTLAYAFVANDAPGEALEVIDRLEQMDFASGANQMHRLLKARALLHAGRRVEAKAVFRQFVDNRIAAADPLDGPGDVGEPAILHPDFVPESEDVIDIPADRSKPAASAS